MAVRSIVMAPPTAPRKSVVLRAGPPPGQGGLRDAIIGVIGALLLLGTIWMAVALPTKDVLPPQYKVSFLDAPAEFTSASFNFTRDEKGSHHDFLYTSPGDDVYQIEADISFTDNVAASAPDLFLLQLFDGHGNQVGADNFGISTPITNTEGVQDPNFPIQYKAGSFGQKLTQSYTIKPADVIVETPLNTTGPELEHQMEASNHVDTSGVWKLRVTLVNAGDCPAPSTGGAPSAEQVARMAACQDETQKSGGHDLGNSLTVGSFTFRRFEPVAQRLA